MKFNIEIKPKEWVLFMVMFLVIYFVCTGNAEKAVELIRAVIK